MANRGRKPKEKKGYFCEAEEDAIVMYLTEEDPQIRNVIFQEMLLPALTKMIESIIRTYKLYVQDENFDQTFNDTISYLITKINNFKPGIGKKAYSYLGTICKRYLIQRNIQLTKERQRTTPFYDVVDDLNDDVRYSVEDKKNVRMAETLISKSAQQILSMIENDSANTLNANEVKVGIAIAELLNNWEEILQCNDDCSKKFTKSAVLYFLKESTGMTTKEVRDNMKKYKFMYNMIKADLID